jgi:hypothetical protein
MNHKSNLRIYAYLVAAWIVLLVLQYFGHRYYPGNFLVYAVDSLTPLSIIVLVVVFRPSYARLPASRGRRCS